LAWSSSRLLWFVMTGLLPEGDLPPRCLHVVIGPITGSLVICASLAIQSLLVEAARKTGIDTERRLDAPGTRADTLIPRRRLATRLRISGPRTSTHGPSSWRISQLLIWPRSWSACRKPKRCRHQECRWSLPQAHRNAFLPARCWLEIVQAPQL